MLILFPHEMKYKQLPFVDCIVALYGFTETDETKHMKEINGLSLHVLCYTSIVQCGYILTNENVIFSYHTYLLATLGIKISDIAKARVIISTVLN